MSDWRDISSAPLNGTLIELRRIHQGRLIAVGRGFFGPDHPNAPSRTPIEPDPLGRPEIIDRYALVKRADVAKWQADDGLYRFPTPTEWRPLSPESKTND